MRHYLPVLGLSVVVTSCGPRVLVPTTFSAQYAPAGTPSVRQVAPDCARYRALAFQDSRLDRQVVGMRFIEGQTGREPISMQGDAAEWVRQGASRLLPLSMLSESPSATADLVVSLRSIQLEEEAYRWASYRAQVVIDVQAVDPATRAVRWSLREAGVGTNRGRAGEPINYQETVSRALDEALGAAFGDSGLQGALCGNRRAGAIRVL